MRLKTKGRLFKTYKALSNSQALSWDDILVFLYIKFNNKLYESIIDIFLFTCQDRFPELSQFRFGILHDGSALFLYYIIMWKIMRYKLVFFSHADQALSKFTASRKSPSKFKWLTAYHPLDCLLLMTTFEQQRCPVEFLKLMAVFRANKKPSEFKGTSN